jgi:hypothetical protein
VVPFWLRLPDAEKPDGCLHSAASAGALQGQQQRRAGQAGLDELAAIGLGRLAVVAACCSADFSGCSRFILNLVQLAP